MKAILPTLRISVLLVLAGLLLPCDRTAHSCRQQQPAGGLLIDRADLLRLPMSGPAWDALAACAREAIVDPDLSDQDDRDNVRALAKALVYARTGNPQMRDEVILACRGIIGTQGGSTLPLARELAAYVLAADLVDLPSPFDAEFARFLDAVRREDIGGRTLISTQLDRPNNWGTMSAASRIAVALYLRDSADLADAARVFHGWLGNRAEYDGFVYGELWWQADPARPVGINPPGSTIQGQDVGGVLPDDQRRSGPFFWPPPQENYVYESLQGALLTAILLDRAGYDDVWRWEDEAIRRAFLWLQNQAAYTATGDDDWQPFVVNRFCGTNLPTVAIGTTPGKNFGFADWLYP